MRLRLIHMTLFNIRDYINNLNRTHLAREDFESVLSNKKKFINIIYTDNDTYLSKTALELVEEVIGLSLFDGL